MKVLCAVNGDFFQTWSLSQASVAALVKGHFSSGKISENYDNVHDIERFIDVGQFVTFFFQ